MRTEKFLLLYIYLFTTISLSAQGFIIKGKVLDDHDQKPLLGVNILIEQLKIGSTTDENGSFEFKNLPKGTYSLKASYIGHRTEIRTISVPAKDELIIKLREGSVDIQEIVVTGNPFSSDPKEFSQSATTISALDLQIKRGSNLAQTLNFQPGISMRTNGTATARPVIRGFSNNRILILENGLRMGDLSGTSDDHAVSTDGSAPEKIEILRGPASLLYGSNAIGGVINVITEAIPNYIPHGLNGDLNLTNGSVNKEYSAAADIHYGIKNFAFHGNYFDRRSNDYKDGYGIRVPNSDQSSHGYQFGFSIIPSFGLAGMSYNYFSNNYGLPLNSNEAEPVQIKMNKSAFRFLAESQSLNSFIKSFSLKGGFQNYEHQEVSRNTGEIGTAFALNTFSTDLSFKHEQIDSTFQGVFGFWGLNQKYRVSGEEAFTPNADYLSLAAYLFEQIKINKFSFQFGGRIEINTIKIPSSTISDTFFPAGEKSYNSLSGSLGIVYNLDEEISLFSNIANAFRAPTIEELTSFAIHEATASFDIGDRNLQNEKNLGLDFGFRLRKQYHQVELSGFYNSIVNYIFRNPTDLFYDPEASDNRFNSSSGIPVHRYSQSDAILYGFEAKAQYDMLRYFTTTVVFDYARGKHKSGNENLPQIPPLRFSLEERYSTDYFWAGMIFKLTAGQNFTASNEISTKGYGVVDIYMGIKFFTGNLIHMINLKVDNLLDQPYKEHLSALKEFAFMPGRNIELSYKFLF